MQLGFRITAGWTLLALAMSAGCALYDEKAEFAADLGGYAEYVEEAEFPDSVAFGPPDALLAPPITLKQFGEVPYYDMTLDEAIRITLTNSTVLRDLGGAVLRLPENLATTHQYAISETDPRFGPVAALSAFDAQLFASGNFENNDRPLNNIFFGGGTRELQQDLVELETELRKRTATGASFFLRNNTDYDANNSPGNRFPSAWTVRYEAGFRHPLLQGGGLDFNRIAGPESLPGAYNGVVIARLNVNVRVADFQAALRDLLSETENAYWDLYYAYRELDAKIEARDASLDVWRSTLAKAEAGRRGGEDEKQEQALEQFHRLSAEAQDALAGRPGEGPRTAAGASSGVFRVRGGVHAAERRLRLALGLPINDGRLIRPIEEPILAPVLFEWSKAAAEAMHRRVELHRQHQLITRREMEVLAAKNFLLPQLDIFGLYRWRGFGSDLLDPTREGRPEFDNAYANLTQGDYQEWQLGFEYLLPIGLRRGHMAVRNAQLRLARDHAIYDEQQRQIIHDLSAQLAELERAYQAARTQYNRRAAAKRQLRVLLEKEARGFVVDVGALLNAHRVAAEAEIDLHRALTEYVLAVKNVHYEKGSLLDYEGVRLAEDGSITAPNCPPLVEEAPSIDYRLPEFDDAPPPPPPLDAATGEGRLPDGSLPPAASAFTPQPLGPMADQANHAAPPAPGKSTVAPISWSAPEHPRGIGGNAPALRRLPPIELLHRGNGLTGQ